MNVSDFVVVRLAQWGIDRVFGYPGDGINGMLGAFQRDATDGHHIRFVQARHEEMAAFMACGHAKFTGNLGVCTATSGPGAIHLLNGLYDAKLDHVPVLAIVGQTARTAIGGDYQQEVDLPALFKDVAHEYVQTAMTPSQVRQLVDRAVRIAIAERTVTCLILPKDLQELEYEEPAHVHDTLHTGIGYRAPIVVPEYSELRRAADILDRGERVAMLVGAGARHAMHEVLAMADELGAGIAKALLGRDVVPDDLPFVTGAIGMLGTEASVRLMGECDTLFVIGSSFPYAEFLPESDQASGVQIDLDARRIGLRFPMTSHLVGDAKATLTSLLPLVRRKSDRTWRRKVERWVSDWWKVVEERAHLDANPINPQLVFWELSKRLPDRCIITADTGTATEWFARNLKLRAGMSASVSGALATMGCAVPYAFAAKLAFPTRAVIACVGDGAMQMNGMAELLTIARHCQEWPDPRLVVLVLDNGDLSFVTWEMRAMAGNPKFETSQGLPHIDYAAFAELAGLRGIRVERPDRVGDAWDEALSADRPVVIDARCDPNVPPLPPHITLEQAKAFASSLIDDPDRAKLLAQVRKHLLH